MGQVRVVTDSAADLSSDVVEQLGITVVPLSVRFGTQVFSDGQLSTEDFWQRVAAGPHHPGTSQPSMGAFEEAFSRLVDMGHQVLCLTLTGKHSGTFSTASAAAQRFGDQVRVMDTLSLSLGQGFQVLAAARASLQGLGLDELARLVEKVRERTHLLILLDSIEHLRRGGREDGIIALLAKVTQALKIKPMLTLSDGRLSLRGLVRTHKKGLERLKQDIGQLGPLESIAIIHTRSAEVASQLAAALAAKLHVKPSDIVVTETGPLLSTHAGPGVIGVAAVQRAV